MEDLPTPQQRTVDPVDHVSGPGPWGVAERIACHVGSCQEQRNGKLLWMSLQREVRSTRKREEERNHVPFVFGRGHTTQDVKGIILLFHLPQTTVTRVSVLLSSSYFWCRFESRVHQTRKRPLPTATRREGAKTKGSLGREKHIVLWSSTWQTPTIRSFEWCMK